MAEPVTIPDAIGQGINKIAKEHGKSKEEIVKELTEIAQSNRQIQKLKDNQLKIRAAWGILASRYVSMPTTATALTIQPITIGTARTTTKSVVNDLYALTWLEDGKEPIFSYFSAWGKAADKVEKMDIDTKYSVMANIKKTKEGITGIIRDSEGILKLDDTPLDTAKFFEKMHKSHGCTIATAKDKLSEVKENLKIAVIKGVVTQANLTNDGNSCMYGIIDETFASTDRLNSFVVYCNADQLLCGIGSTAFFMGKIGERDSNGDKDIIMRKGMVSAIELMPIEAPEGQSQQEEG